MAEYGPCKGKESTCHDGIPIDLVLKRRLDNPPESPYYCFCWRTRLPSNKGKSRRFYSSKEYGFWTIPVSVALDVVGRVKDRGLLDLQYDDLRHRDGTRWSTIIDSRELDPGRAREERLNIICNEGEPDWGDAPVFIICHSQDSKYGAWREIMIVDSEREFCTFRCTTTNSTYRMGIYADRLQGNWRLDNAMQEASAASMREFLRCLEEISR